MYRLYWLEQFLPRPSVYRLLSGFGDWESRAGLSRTFQRLEEQAVLEAEGRSLDRIVRLTEKGRRLIEGPSGVSRRWERKWDGLWRMVVFDVPESERKLRQRLRRTLADHGFGCLQKSVWISPDPFAREFRKLRRNLATPASLTLIEGNEIAGRDPKNLVRAAWHFGAINRAYEDYLAYLRTLSGPENPSASQEVLAREQSLWEAAVSRDPFLPAELLPRGYCGRKAWKKRQRDLPGILRRWIAPECDN